MKYAQLSQGEVKFLYPKKLGTSEWAVYLCLAAHCHAKDWCNPTFNKMHIWFGKSKSEKTIETAMTGLVKKGVVVRGYKGEQKRFRLTYRINNPSVTNTNQNPPKVKKGPQDLSLNVRDQNPPKVKKNDTPKVESIREKKRKEKLKDYSISNEVNNDNIDCDVEKEKQKVEALNVSWRRKAFAITHNYDWLVKATGKVIEESDKQRIYDTISAFNTDPEEVNEQIVNEIWNKKYFGK
jgi:predicted transcriptional regulator